MITGRLKSIFTTPRLQLLLPLVSLHAPGVVGKLSSPPQPAQMIDFPFFVETTGAAIYMFARKGTAEKGGVNGSVAVFSQADEIIVAAVSGGLEGICRDRQTLGAAETVELTASPSGHIHRVAKVH